MPDAAKPDNPTFSYHTGWSLRRPPAARLPLTCAVLSEHFPEIDFVPVKRKVGLGLSSILAAALSYFCAHLSTRSACFLLTHALMIFRLFFPTSKYFSNNRGIELVSALCVPEYLSVISHLRGKYYTLASLAGLLKYVEHIQNFIWAPRGP